MTVIGFFLSDDKYDLGTLLLLAPFFANECNFFSSFGKFMVV